MGSGRIIAAVAAGLVVLACAGSAMLFRYEPLAVQSNPYYLLLWDRLGQRECATPRPGFTTASGIACTKDELADLGARISLAKLTEDRQRQAMFRIAGNRFDGVVLVAQLRAGGFHENEIADYVAEKRRAMLNAGVPKRMVDAFWGGDPYAMQDAAALSGERDRAPASM
jgi:hypothetical protein